MKNLLLLFIAFLFLHLTTFAQWDQLTDMPTARYLFTSCELNGKIYVIGGGASLYSSMDIMEVYDPISDSWDTTKAPMPTSRVELGACMVNGKIYAIGGAAYHSASPFGMVEEYDPLTNTWDTFKDTMTTPRKGAAYGVINNKIYVAGGSAYSSFSPSNKLEIYDPVTDNWTSGANMLSALYEPEGAVVNDTFYVIGGLIGSPWTGQTTVQKYNPVTDIWSSVTSLDTGRVGHTASEVDGKIYVIGGDRQPPRLISVMQYDPNTNAWTWFDDAPSFMISQTASVLNSVIYVFGGSTTSMPNFTPSSAVWSFDPTIVNVESQNNNIVPEYFVLDQNYPNPFNPSTKIKYSVPQSSNAVIKVFDILGNEIETLVNELKSVGTYEITWNAESATGGLPSGVYIYRIQTGSFVETKKMVLMK